IFPLAKESRLRFVTPDIAVASASVSVPSGVTYTVNVTDDAKGVGLGTSCDTQPFIPGEQCTLRAALRATNNVGTGATININIPLSDSGCDSATGRCTINLTQALPNITGPVEIIGPGADKIAVQRASGGAYRIFTVTSNGSVVIHGLTV